MKKTGKSLLSIIVSLAMVISTITCIMPSVFADSAQVTFDPGDGYVYPTYAYADDNDHIEIFPIPYAPDGYTFVGWFDGDKQYNSADNITGDMTLCAKYVECPMPAIYSCGFEGDLDAEGWTFYDADDDGYGWGQVNFENKEKVAYDAAALMSASYCDGSATSSGFALTPDNWAISPKIEIPINNPSLAFMAIAQDERWYEEHFKVYVGETEVLEDMVCISGEEDVVLTDDGNYTRFEYDLSEFAGKEAFIAIRHYNCTDQYQILIDQFEVYGVTEEYRLFVGGVQVTDANKGDIFGDGTCDYNSQDNILIIRTDINVDEGPAIESYIDGLIIIFIGNVTITSNGNGLELYASTTITSEEKVIINAGGTGILLECYNEDEHGTLIPTELTIMNADIEIYGTNGIQGSENCEGLLINNSDVIIQVTDNSTDTENESGAVTGIIKDEQNAVNLLDCEIVEPEEAQIKDGAILDGDDVVANRVVITANYHNGDDTDTDDSDNETTSGEDTDGNDTDVGDTDGGDTDGGNDRPFKVYQRGDANLDDIVDIIDVVMIRAHIIHQTELTGLNLRVSECNDDENVDIIDVVMIRSHIVNGTELGTIIIYDDELK